MRFPNVGPSIEPKHRLLVGDLREVLKGFPANHFDSVVCDPPYDLTQGKRTVPPPHIEGSPYSRHRMGMNGDPKASRGFMGKEWDGTGVAFDPETWKAVYRVLKPGGYLLAFGGTRTFHRLFCAVEDAGFVLNDTIAAWIFGSGFPKSMDISKALDKAAGAEREVVGKGKGRTGVSAQPNGGSTFSDDNYQRPGEFTVTAPSTDEAKKWEGYGTALKPAFEPICVAKKPNDGTYVENVLKWECGGLNIDGCRIGSNKQVPASVSSRTKSGCYGEFAATEQQGVGGHDPNLGRWPANIVLDEVCAELLDQQSGGASRFFLNVETPFFYCAKASRAERNKGCDDLPEQPLLWSAGTQSPGTFQAENTHRAAANYHPTVKPLKLMRWLCRLVTPHNGLLLDPFCGSGSTFIAALQENLRCVGVDISPEYIEIARQRILNN